MRYVMQSVNEPMNYPQNGSSGFLRIVLAKVELQKMPNAGDLCAAPTERQELGRLYQFFF